MNTQKTLEDIKVSLKMKLATLWASFMFLYIMLIILPYICRIR